MCCLECGYALDRLPSNRCPECGREFDPRDAASYWNTDGPKYAALSPKQLLILTLLTLAMDLVACLAVPHHDLFLVMGFWGTIILHVSLGSFVITAAIEDRDKRWSLIVFASLVAMCPLPFLYALYRGLFF